MPRLSPATLAIALTLAAACSGPGEPAPAGRVKLPRYAQPVRGLRAPGEANPRTRAACNLTYYGGRVLSNTKVYAVNWTSAVASTVKNNIGSFYGDIMNSPHIDWLSEYDTAGLTGAADGLPGSNQHIGRGTFGGSYTITPSVAGTSLTNADIGSELAAQIGAGNLPQPDLDAAGNVNAIYMFDFPPGYSIDLDGAMSCSYFCAYHYTITIGGKSVPYGVHPDVSTGACASGCGSGTTLQIATSIHSHELIEAITDTEVGLASATGPAARPLAWMDESSQSCGEIGDICNGMDGTITVSGRTWTIQKEWSNASAACIVQGTACTAGSCSGSRPVCETSGPKAGQCVQCNAGDTTACFGATPYCNTTTDTCVECASNNDCPPTAPCTSRTCDAASGMCTQPTPVANGTACNDGNACTTNDTCQSGSCVGGSGVVCTAQDACHDIGACNPSTGVCSNPAKANGSACNDQNACTQTDTCQSGVCVGGNPVSCTAQDACHDVGTCNGSTGVCSQPAKPDGTACPGGRCQSGACLPFGVDAGPTPDGGGGGADGGGGSGDGGGGSGDGGGGNGDGGLSCGPGTHQSGNQCVSNGSGNNAAPSSCGCGAGTPPGALAFALGLVGALRRRRRS